MMIAGVSLAGGRSLGNAIKISTRNNAPPKENTEATPSGTTNSPNGSNMQKRPKYVQKFVVGPVLQSISPITSPPTSEVCAAEDSGMSFKTREKGLSNKDEGVTA